MRWFFGYMPSTGMAVVRVLGDDMKLEDIMSLAPVIKNADLSSLDLEPSKPFFNNKKDILQLYKKSTLISVLFLLKALCVKYQYSFPV